MCRKKPKEFLKSYAHLTRLLKTRNPPNLTGPHHWTVQSTLSEFKIEIVWNFKDWSWGVEMLALVVVMVDERGRWGVTQSQLLPLLVETSPGGDGCPASPAGNCATATKCISVQTLHIATNNCTEQRAESRECSREHRAESGEKLTCQLFFSARARCAGRRLLGEKISWALSLSFVFICLYLSICRNQNKI